MIAYLLVNYADVLVFGLDLLLLLLDDLASLANCLLQSVVLVSDLFE